MTNEQLIQDAAKAGVTLKNIEVVYGVTLDGTTTMGYLVQADGLVWQITGGTCKRYGNIESYSLTVDAHLAAKHMTNPKINAAAFVKFPNFAVNFIR
jgi:hypothetical protein